MAKFLTTNHISAQLEDLIKSAQDYIVLISPYMKVNQRLQGFIQGANRRGVRFTIIYGKQDMKPDEREWINQLTTVRIIFVQNLHAKCYLSDNAAIITSMNLYEFSQQNNDEMGILVTRTEELDLYQEIYEEVLRLQDTGTPEHSKGSTAPSETVPASTTNGYCIRCCRAISLDSDKPFCSQCYQSWARYRNETYTENYCHCCGKENNTSMEKPLCRPCFRSA